jgi:hypothetical protein
MGMRKLAIPNHIHGEIVSLITETPEGLETGVTLFGTSVPTSEPASRKSGDGDTNAPGFDDVVLAVAGPGNRATHQSARYSGDENFSNAIYEALRSALPGIRWLGELHVHPMGMTWLSRGDYRTVKEILTGMDETLHPHEFIAGVMQRRNGDVEIYPYHFTREWLKGSAMELLVVESDAPVVRQARQKGIEDGRPCVCEKPEGGRTARQEAPRHRWLRQWWERFCRHGRKGRDRQVHPR